jgi:hypothetical protein
VAASNVEMKKIDWLWSNYLARGKLTMLSGPSELGKSTVAIDWSARLSRGSERPDGDSAPLASAIITVPRAINDTIVPRLAAAGADLDRVHLLTFAKTDGVTRTFSLQVDLDRLGEKDSCQPRHAAQRPNWLAGHLGFEPANPSASYLIGIP